MSNHFTPRPITDDPNQIDEWLARNPGQVPVQLVDHPDLSAHAVKVITNRVINLYSENWYDPATAHRQLADVTARLLSPDNPHRQHITDEQRSRLLVALAAA